MSLSSKESPCCTSMKTSVFGPGVGDAVGCSAWNVDCVAGCEFDGRAVEGDLGVAGDHEPVFGPVLVSLVAEATSGCHLEALDLV